MTRRAHQARQWGEPRVVSHRHERPATVARTGRRRRPKRSTPRWGAWRRRRHRLLRRHRAALAHRAPRRPPRVAEWNGGNNPRQQPRHVEMLGIKGRKKDNSTCPNREPSFPSAARRREDRHEVRFPARRPRSVRHRRRRPRRPPRDPQLGVAQDDAPALEVAFSEEFLAEAAALGAGHKLPIATPRRVRARSRRKSPSPASPARSARPSAAPTCPAPRTRTSAAPPWVSASSRRPHAPAPPNARSSATPPSAGVPRARRASPSRASASAPTPGPETFEKDAKDAETHD